MCPKIKMGGGKNGCGQGSKWGGKIFWKFFRGGGINFPRHFHSCRTRMKQFTFYYKILDPFRDRLKRQKYLIYDVQNVLDSSANTASSFSCNLSFQRI